MTKKVSTLLNATLKDAQMNFMLNLLNFDNLSTTLIAPTGWGKSFCFIIPTILSNAVTFLVSPLISLINDQHRQLTSLRCFALLGVISDALLELINSSIADLNIPLFILCSPEKFNLNPKIKVLWEKSLSTRPQTFLILDEIHTFLAAGLTYRQNHIITADQLNFNSKVKVVGCTATLTPESLSDLENLMHLKCNKIFRITETRTNLAIAVLNVVSDSIRTPDCFNISSINADMESLASYLF